MDNTTFLNFLPPLNLDDIPEALTGKPSSSRTPPANSNVLPLPNFDSPQKTSSPQKPQKQRAFSVMERAFRQPIPPTPKKKQRKVEAPIHIFNGTCLDLQSARLPFTIPSDVQRYFFLQGSALGKPCIQQPPQKQSCGAGAAIMLLSDALEQDPTLTLKDSFWKWYLSTILASQCDVMDALYNHTNLKEVGYEVKSIFYHSPEKIEAHDCKRKGVDYVGVENHGKALLESLKALGTLPLIVSITNHRIDGHWIVIDTFTADGYVLVRDPYSGNAYQILAKELLENWPPEEEVKVIYITKEPETGSGKSD